MGNCIYTMLEHSTSFRVFKENTEFLPVPLGERANEKTMPATSYFLGMKSTMSTHLSFDFALGYQRFGEQYQSNSSDTNYRYTNRYSYFVLPLKLQFQTGKKFQFYVNAGLQAQFFSSYKQVTIINEKETDPITVKKLDDHNTIGLATTGSVGLRYLFASRYSLFMEGTGTYQFTNTFDSQADYKHYPYSYGFRFGLGFHL